MLLLSRFTESSMLALFFAQEEARRLGHKAIGSEYLLLGLIGCGCSSSQALEEVGVNLQEARIEVEKVVGKGSGLYSVLDFPFTPRARKILELSLSISEQLKAGDVSTKHLLLGLIDSALEGGKKPGAAARVFHSLNVDLAALRNKALNLDEQDCAPPQIIIVPDVTDLQTRAMQEADAFYLCLNAFGEKKFHGRRQCEIVMPTAVAQKLLEEIRGHLDKAAYPRDSEI
jgi:ATP-dependent Clp protease ATP-binding subunit ClpA